MPESPECQKIRKGGLEHYGTECFGRLIFATIKKCGTERVKLNE